THTNLTGGNTFVATRTWTATDACGNAKSCSQTIALVDTTKPSITCTGNKTNECGVGSLTFDEPTASDTCGSVTVSILGTVTNLGRRYGEAACTLRQFQDRQSYDCAGRYHPAFAHLRWEQDQ